MERTNANGGKKGPTQWPRAPAGGQAGRRRAREAKRYFRTHFKRWKRAIRDPEADVRKSIGSEWKTKLRCRSYSGNDLVIPTHSEGIWICCT